MRTLRRKRHWRADVIAAFARAMKHFESGESGLEDITGLYKLAAGIAADNRLIRDTRTRAQMAEFAEELVEHDHAIEPDNKYEVLFHFVSAYLYAHVPAGILKEMEADRVMDYLNDTLDLFMAKESEPADLDDDELDEPFSDDWYDGPSDDETRAYDPDVAPDKLDWIDTDEGEQLHRIMQFHESHGEYGESLEAHAALHVAIETQIATDTPEVEATLDRLVKQGLTRHDAIHAIGSVLADSIEEILASDESETADANARYYEKLSRLNASDWLS
ncbi:MAG TPA: hypothetical protein VIV14_10970 [Gammaproteobacteria bacterium]